MRAVIGSGQQYPSVINTIDFVTMATLGDATDFGDSTTVMVLVLPQVEPDVFGVVIQALKNKTQWILYR